MLTKNFYSYMRAALQNTSAEFTSRDGSIKTLSLTSSVPPFQDMNNWSTSIENTGVRFGTGTTPATASDFTLESTLWGSSISVSTPSTVSFSRGDTFDEYSVSFGVTNITDKAITISEVGLIALPSNEGVANSNTIYVLVDRTVLDVPVTILPNEIKHIAYTIRFNYGNAV